MNITEIEKALEYCLGNTIYEENCTKCAYNAYHSKCMNKLLRDAIDVINLQKAEIEKWKEAFNNLDKIARPNLAFVEAAKKQAVREFAEKLKDSLSWRTEPIDGYDIDELVKEMVGEEE